MKGSGDSVAPLPSATDRTLAAPRYRLVIFDFDGTLADTYAWFSGVLNEVADRYRFRRIGHDEVEIVRRMNARDLIRHIGLPAWKLPLVSRHMRALAARDIARIRLFPGVDAMLTALDRQGIDLALVSSNSEANIRHVLGPLAARFRHFDCGAGLFGKAKRLRRTMRACGALPETTLAIGDELRDIEAAHAAGCAFGAVTWGYTAGDALLAGMPDHVFGSPQDIAAILEDAARRVQRPRLAPGTGEPLLPEPNGS